MFALQEENEETAVIRRVFNKSLQQVFVSQSSGLKLRKYFFPQKLFQTRRQLYVCK